MTQTIPPFVTDIASRLVETIRAYGPVAVAFSGGVDSAVVAKAAFEAWGSQAVAITAVSPSLATIERTAAQQVAAGIGIRQIEIPTSEFTRSEYRRNAGDRCFYCKDTLYSLAKERLAELNLIGIINGANADDVGDYRPGMKAAADHHVRSPLIELQISKAGVRQLARYWNLTVSDKPASPCLASRIAYGIEVTEERIARIEQAEVTIRELTGVVDFRVRLEANELARIEVPLAEIERLIASDVREAIVSRFRTLGFRAITLDLEGLRSGNLNATLPMVQLGGAK